MRKAVLGILVVLSLPVPATRADETTAGHAQDLDSLRHAWHRCVRNAFSGQPESLGKLAAEREALAACKAGEDRYVAALLAARAAEEEAARREGRTLVSRARAWAASIAAYVIDPVSSWLAAPTR
ncbi:hypothetical protein [Methylobacterium segetis]|uniref:hypothetical protein n=1 Tax=Methylobacterium segetis TaxID=2488750 RepID=UPI0010476F80|nr:hypothetical protein [Methylobacterium segetis]